MYEIYETVFIKILPYITNIFYILYYIVFSTRCKNHLKFVVQSKAYQTDMPPLFRSLHTDLTLILRHEYLDIFPCTWPKDNGERKNKKKKIQANFYAVDAFFREYRVFSRTKEFKSGREGYGCFYDRLSIRPSPDSDSLLLYAFSYCRVEGHTYISRSIQQYRSLQLVRN